MKTKISLPFGGLKAEFDVEELINYYKSQNVDYLIIGAIHVTVVNHKKNNTHLMFGLEVIIVLILITKTLVKQLVK